jgi:hypothetical protein
MIVGVSEGRTVRCDPYPIAKNIEVAAIIAGRVTYTWHLGMLQRRPPILTGPVLANHVCGKILPHVAPPPSPPPCYVPPF